MIDVGLSSNYPHLVKCLEHVGCSPGKIDIVVLSHEHLDHIGAAWHFGGRTIIAAHRLAANKIMLRDDFRCCARCSTSRTCRSMSISGWKKAI